MRVLLKNTGEIASTFNGSRQVIDLNTPSDAIYIDTDEAIASSDYYDFDLHQFVKIGVPPSFNHTFDYRFKQWVDLRPIDEIKEKAWTKIKAQRNKTEFGGFVFEGNTYDSDQISQGRIFGAAMYDQPQIWTLADNTTVLLSGVQLNNLHKVMQSHITDAHVRGRIAREAINAALTKEEVNAVIY